jgi:uncharacterized protein YdhG (YjbR/CyaY superfamily)
MKIESLLDKLAAPARRAIAGLGLRKVEELAKIPEAEIRGLRGIGPRAMELMAAELASLGLAFTAGSSAAAAPAKAAPRIAPQAAAPAAQKARSKKAPPPTSAPRAGQRSAEVDAYIAGFPPATRRLLEEMRQTISAAAPEASEKISYQMPTFYLEGNLVHFAAFTSHIGFYPVPTGISAFEKELAPYKQGKGSVQFPLDKPLPLDLVARIVKFRVAENLGKKKKN